MSKQNKNNKARTYARNRTNLSRRGFEKNPEPDSIFMLKLVLSFIAGTFWLKFSNQLSLSGVAIGGLPFGSILALLLVNRLEKRQNNRRIFYAVILLATIISYFLPAGILI